MEKITTLAIISLIVILLIGNVTAKTENNRVIAFGDYEVMKAYENGCKLIKDDKMLKVFECEKKVNIKKVGLTPDLELHITDLASDKQVSADKVWSMKVIVLIKDFISDAISIVTGQLKISSTTQSLIGDNYTLYFSTDLKNWTIKDSLVAQNTDPVYFIQPISGTMGFFKIQHEHKISNYLIGTGRKIVVLDTGYNYNHPELQSSYLGGYDFVNEDNDPMDDNGHGSWVAGVITADGIDPAAKGVAPDVGIIAGKVSDENGTVYLSDTILAIYWAVDNYHPDAISLSAGSSMLYKDGYCDDIAPELTQAIKYATDNNVSVVIASGNWGDKGVSFPGCISQAFTVGAVDSADHLATFSGMGVATDITAPGVNIYSSGLGSNYDYEGGTSLSTPMISGIIALMKQKNPDATPTSIQDTIKATANPVKSKGVNLGRVNAYNAVKASF
jgi:subtilisin family serine protease